MAEGAFDGFRKRSRLVVPFRREKIERAVQAACQAVSRESSYTAPDDLSVTVTDRVIDQLNRRDSEYFVYEDDEGKRIPKIEDIQDLVEIVLAESNETLIVASYKRYRKRREVARSRIRVRGETQEDEVDVTDASLLLVESTSDNVTLPWDHRRIVQAIMEHTELCAEVAVGVAKAVENRIINSDMQTVNTTLIRELVNNELVERGFHDQLRDLSLYGVPKDYVESLMFSKSTENSNIVNNNPEAVNLGLAELILKQWALDTIFSPEVKRAHDTGAIHLHDLGYPHRIYCSSHSIEYVKKYGLRNLINLSTTSNPARSASVLTGHLNTFLASMQANYAGALGIAYINILYAPLLEGMSWKECKQIAQELIFNGSQNAFSRGGQTLFLDFNIHTGIPTYLQSVPAIGPGGRYMLRLSDGQKVSLVEELRDEKDADGYRLMDLYLVDEDDDPRLVLRELCDPETGLVYDQTVAADLADRGEAIVTYGDYQEEARLFCRALLEVWGEGDSNGRVFEFPKCDFHISDETFNDPEQHAVYLEACELASQNGSTYFIFDRDEVTLSACCRLRTTIQSNRMLMHPENMRFCGFQNVTVNIPQAAYRASRSSDDDVVERLYEELDRTMELAAEAHLQKKAKTSEMMSGVGHPLWQVGRPSNDEKPYVELDSCTYIIGLIGLNDAVNFLIDKELHECDEAMQLGLKITAHMYLKAKQLSRKHGLKLTLEESPAESAARRLAKTDLVYFNDEASKVVKGDDGDVVYYTNSIHLAADAPVSLVERIRQQAKYHSLIESGAITHAFIGEERPSAGAIASLMKDAYYRTQSAQVTISPEFTFCDECNHIMRGLLEHCTRCGSDNVYGETRVVGYFSKVQNWNKSKRYGELVARHRGNYQVETAESRTDDTHTDESRPIIVGMEQVSC
jgi:anaerobic ribonucleoside-triphosphate reductase